ncbi:MAG: hypothetical protein PHW46_02250, partial [Candidatus Omnitrophica bacterium]|nr:hypothetical protein [Candidatus Omnitrophota bacterium]
MKKLIASLIIAAFLSVVLMVFAFVYIDLSDHKWFVYEVFIGKRPVGSVRIDKYVTEDKVVYKASAEYVSPIDYPAILEKLIFKRKSMAFQKFTKQSKGARGQNNLALFGQDAGKINFLLLKHPEFLSLPNVSSNKSILVFSPKDISTYTPILGEYNFWQKGAQFFDVLLLFDD